MGRWDSDGRKVYMLLEEIEEPRLMFKFHWLTDETPMFALSLWPTLMAYAFWLHSNDPLKGRE